MVAMKEQELIVVPLAPGFEEIEAVTIIDVLRRAELAVFVAGLEPGPILGAHGIPVGTDGDLADVDHADVAMIVLPGGMPGTTRLAEDERVLALLRVLHESGRPVAAICAAPLVLARAGILEGREATSHPSVRDRLAGARVLDAPRVVRSGTVLTSQGPGTALEFALAIVRDRAGDAKADALARAMLAPQPA
jgi:4-methyl-5(b-hydroxyethyl)-thiazole monophosphate biosynthesis